MPEPFDTETVDTALLGLPGWQRDGITIRKEYTFGDFASAFGFMARMAITSEAMNHHPDWSNSWNRVVVVLTSHDAAGVTQRDIDWAQQAEAAAG